MAERRTDDGWRIPDTLWEDIQLFLPPRVNTHPFGGGRPRVPDRACLDAIFFVLRTGCQWKALDATGICKGSTAHNRFQEWVKAGVFLELWRAGLLEYDALVGIDWEWLSPDGALAKPRVPGYRARRWVVERLHSWLNRFRRVLIRWEKKPENYIAFLHLACAVITYRCAGLIG